MAIRQKDIKALDKTIREVEASRYPELATDLRKARDTLDKLGGGRGGLFFKIYFKHLFFQIFKRLSVLIYRLPFSYVMNAIMFLCYLNFHSVCSIKCLDRRFIVLKNQEKF